MIKDYLELEHLYREEKARGKVGLLVSLYDFESYDQAKQLIDKFWLLHPNTYIEIKYDFNALIILFKHIDSYQTN